MRVKADTEGGKLAGPIAGTIRCGEEATLECIGASSVYQAVKGIYIASGFLAEDGIEISTKIAQINKTIGKKEVTAYIFTVRSVNP